MNTRHLINEDGTPFDSSELQRISCHLDRLNGEDRTRYRNQNAGTIAKHSAAKILIVSGPGTGKSHLFLDRIDHWFQDNPEASIFVTSFVRKLVTDLRNDINKNEKLSYEQKNQTTVYTLHKFARSIVEKNNGTSEWKFQRYFRVIGQAWKKVVWEDVLTHYPDLDGGCYCWKKFEEQLHNNEFAESEDWQKLNQIYFELCAFYNAAGFADLIIRAKDALRENPQLNEDDFFIIDEYQDFNLAEEQLILQLANKAKGLLIVGDDEQVLYEKLKSGKAKLVRRLYNQKKDYVNAMLPFCARSCYHITKLAEYFIGKHRDSDCIEKIYLPLEAGQDTPKVQVIACATPATAIDYIEKFISDNQREVDERKTKLSEEEAQDAFLLILTPERKAKFYGEAKETLHKIVSKWHTESREFSDDYYKVLNYYSLAEHPRNNFTFRKVLWYEDFSEEQTHTWIVEAMQHNKNLSCLDAEEIRDILRKCSDVKNIIETESSTDEKVDKLSECISISDKLRLRNDMDRKAINQDEITKLEHDEEEEAELEEIQIKKMCAVELMTILGSKGLSADHVIIIGFDDVNMKWITKNAFYVALTRARKSLHILTALKSGGAARAHDFLAQLPEGHAEFCKYKKTRRTKSILRSKRAFVRYLNSLGFASKQQR